ncbi:MAG: ABC transporter permease [Planctomycetota bacterium]
MGTTKILRVAWREFASTALTKGFLAGVLLPPIMMIGIIALITFLTATKSAPQVRGEVAVIDPTGRLAEALIEDLSPEASAERVRERSERAARVLGEVSGGVADFSGAVETEDIRAPQLTVVTLDTGVDIEAEKQRIREDADSDDGRLALIVINPAALNTSLSDEESEADGKPRPLDVEFFIRPELDDDVVDEIRDATIDRIRTTRYEIAGYDEDELGRLRTVRTERARELTADGGERGTLGEFRSFLGYGFMMLMLIPTFVGAQYLLTSTVEEKSSRVVEILLSAVSPMQLMTGKVLGQMFVGLVIMVLYGGLSIVALIRFGLGDVLTPLTLVSMLLFFVLAYFTFASFMAAVGSAVNELREAQSLIGPVMVPLIIPYALGFIIADDPNSTFATIASFVPPICPFMMMLRVASTEPPPLWQIGLGVTISAITCYVAVWFAAKVFRVGLLMYGKPPNFRTLIKWVRLA